MSAMEMTLYTGHRVDPWNLNPDDILIENIAHSLSMLCRFGGHSRCFYSVAQHSVRVMEALPPEFKLEGVLHDGTESFVQDLVRPVKRRLHPYKDLELKIWQIIAFKYELPMAMSTLVIMADDAALKSEIRQFVNNPGRDIELENPYWRHVDELPPVDKVWSPEEAKGRFMLAFADAAACRIKALAALRSEVPN